MGVPSMLVLQVFLLFAEALQYDTSVSSTEPSLTGIPQVWRHGSRAPIEDPFVKSPEELKARWTGGIGRLTEQGESEMISLGQFLRNRYRTFFRGWTADSVGVSIMSSAYQRAIKSAELNLQGMFPEKAADGNCTENCQKIPVEIIPAENDTMIDIDYANCPYPFRPLLTNIVEVPGITKLMQEHANTVMQVAKHLKKEPKVADISLLHDALQSYRYHNSMKSHLPEWAQSEKFYKALNDFESERLSRWLTCQEYRRLRGSNLFKRIADQLAKAAKTNMSETSLKYAGYSGHDLTIAALLVDWDYVGPQFMPQFAACVMVELRKKGQHYFVEAWYKQGHHHVPLQIRIKECDWQCPLETFVEFANQLSSIDLSAQCAEFEAKNLRYAKVPH